MRGAYTPFLPLWVIYYDPLDYPGQVVLRCQYAVPSVAGEVHPCRVPSYVGNSFVDARKAIPHDAVFIGREPGDEPQIVEVWV